MPANKPLHKQCISRLFTVFTVVGLFHFAGFAGIVVLKVSKCTCIFLFVFGTVLKEKIVRRVAIGGN